MTSQQLNFVGPQSSSNSVVEWLLKWTGTDTQKADNNNKKSIYKERLEMRRIYILRILKINRTKSNQERNECLR